MPTSVIYRGNHLYYFKKAFENMDEKFVLQRMNLDGLEFGECLNQYDDYKINQCNVQPYFAVDGDTKGRKLCFKKQELEELNEEGEKDFLDSQFVQVVNP